MNEPKCLQDLSPEARAALRVELAAARRDRVQPNIDVNRGYAPMTFGADKNEPIAIVGYGPSLKKTWEQLREFKYIWTTSGAHDFLVERGIIPTFHTDVDWSDHKTKFIAKPDPQVRYVLANTVSQSYLSRMAGQNVEMFEPVLPLDLYTSYNEYPVVPVSGGAGAAAILLAHLDGWKNQTWFGLEHSYEWEDPQPEKENIANAVKHAGWHQSTHIPSELIYVNVCEGGKFYESSLQLINMAQLLVKVVQKYGVKSKIVGGGLLQAWIEHEEQQVAA